MSCIRTYSPSAIPYTPNLVQSDNALFHYPALALQHPTQLLGQLFMILLLIRQHIGSHGGRSEAQIEEGSSNEGRVTRRRCWCRGIGFLRRETLVERFGKVNLIPGE